MWPEWLVEKFWSGVDRSGGPDVCWPWTRARVGKDGYGRFYIPGSGGRSIRAHRFARWITDGREPDGKVLHHCDNPPCCNPADSYVGTDAQNVADMYRRDRAAVGSRHPSSKLTEDEARAICLRWPYENHAALAREFGVSTVLVWKIGTGRTWRHVTQELLA